MDPHGMLKEVNNAIYTIMIGGQEYRIGTKYLKRADLGMLQKLKRELEAEIAAGTDNGLMQSTSVAYFDRR